MGAVGCSRRAGFDAPLLFVLVLEAPGGAMVLFVEQCDIHMRMRAAACLGRFIYLFYLIFEELRGRALSKLVV